MTNLPTAIKLSKTMLFLILLIQNVGNDVGYAAMHLPFQGVGSSMWWAALRNVNERP